MIDVFCDGGVALVSFISVNVVFVMVICVVDDVVLVRGFVFCDGDEIVMYGW